MMFQSSLCTSTPQERPPRHTKTQPKLSWTSLWNLAFWKSSTALANGANQCHLYPNLMVMRAEAHFVHLKKFVKRPVHQFPTPKDIIAQIPGTSRYFTVFDAKSGYWQIPLDQDSIPLTTFITKWGCYRYLRTLMGLTSSGFVQEQIRLYLAFLVYSSSWITSSWLVIMSNNY